MSRRIFDLRFEMNRLDEEGNYVDEYIKDVSHQEEIQKLLCESWNKTVKPEFFDGVLKDRISSCKMSPRKNRKNYVSIYFVFKDGIRVTQKYEKALIEQMDGQLSDGWGEGVFGEGNAFTLKDGTKYFIE